MNFTITNNGSNTYRVSQPALYRDGNLLVLTATLGCVSGTSGACDPTFWDLAGIATVPPQPVLGGEAGSIEHADQEAQTLSGFYLFDPQSGAEYIPVRRSDAVPLTSNLTQQIPPSAAYQVWIYFPAPPSTTTGLSLVSPRSTVRLGPIPIS
jgi:hypothetical protein